MTVAIENRLTRGIKKVKLGTFKIRDGSRYIQRTVWEIEGKTYVKYDKNWYSVKHSIFGGYKLLVTPKPRKLKPMMAKDFKP